MVKLKTLKKSWLRVTHLISNLLIINLLIIDLFSQFATKAGVYNSLCGIAQSSLIDDDARIEALSVK